MEPSRYALTRDPLFYVTAAFFALLTTGLPGLMGQQNFMPIVQAAGLAVFTAIVIRQRHTGRSILVVLLWLTVQVFTLAAITRFALPQAEQAIGDGFGFRADYLEWFYTGRDLPGSVASQPLGRVAEVAGVALGSLLTGGLVGAWFLVKSANLYAFSLGSLLESTATPLGLVAGLTPWALLRLGGYAGLFVLLAEPILVGWPSTGSHEAHVASTEHPTDGTKSNTNWSSAYYVHQRRSLLLTTVGLLLAGLLLELTLPAGWSALLRPNL